MLSLFDGIATGEALEEHCPGGLQHWISGLNSLMASNLSLKAWWGEGHEGQGDPPRKGMRAGAPLLLDGAVEDGGVERWREGMLHRVPS